MPNNKTRGTGDLTRTNCPYLFVCCARAFNGEGSLDVHFLKFVRKYSVVLYMWMFDEFIDCVKIELR